MIAVMDKNRAIGAGGALLWDLPGDMAHFRACTVGKTVVMGRTTYESIGHALPGRRNIVLSRGLAALPDAEVVRNVEQVLESAEHEDIWIIGGQQIYEQFLSYADELYITAVDDIARNADRFFPPFESDCQLLESTLAPHDADVAYEFRRYGLKNRGKSV